MVIRSETQDIPDYLTREEDKAFLTLIHILAQLNNKIKVLSYIYGSGDPYQNRDVTKLMRRDIVKKFEYDL